MINYAFHGVTLIKCKDLHGTPMVPKIGWCKSMISRLSNALSAVFIRLLVIFLDFHEIWLHIFKFSKIKVFTLKPTNTESSWQTLQQWQNWFWYYFQIVWFHTSGFCHFGYHWVPSGYHWVSLEVFKKYIKWANFFKNTILIVKMIVMATFDGTQDGNPIVPKKS